MESAAGNIENEMPLQQGYQKSGEEPEPRGDCKKCNYHKKSTVTLAVVVLGLIITVIVQAVLLSGCSSAALGPACPNGWIGYRGKCYYFSEVQGNWT
ncbi:C-type lectin domain family 2 member E-like [Chrysemys picta bellii]|uniref:C-type lectin domain family 2 member E-like n=1 Tax=Chrysemys picta bellii TaxID=8478 RepID=UPI0032B1AA8E